MKPPLLTRIWLWLQIVLLRWNISSDEQYMLQLEREGILDGHMPRYWRQLLQEDRVRLALLEARLRGAPMAVPMEATP